MTERDALSIIQTGSGFFSHFSSKIQPLALVENMITPIRAVKSLSSGLNTLRFKKSKAHVKSSDKYLAEIAQDVYNPPIQRKSKGYIRELSNDEIGVYENYGVVSVSVRGTQNMDDAKTDAFLASGTLKNTARYKRNKKQLYDIQKITGHIDEITGHSLGAALAQALGDVFKNARVVAFNPGAGITGAYGKGSTIYASKGDIVSALAMGTRNHEVRIVDSPGDSILDRHAVSNFS